MVSSDQKVVRIYPHDDQMRLYRCKECGKVSVSLGYLHGHIEKHQGFGPFNLIPNPFKTANPAALMEKTEVLYVREFAIDDTDKVPITKEN